MRRFVLFWWPWEPQSKVDHQYVLMAGGRVAAPKAGICDVCARLEVLKNGVVTVLGSSCLLKFNVYSVLVLNCILVHILLLMVQSSTSHVADPVIFVVSATIIPHAFCI